MRLRENAFLWFLTGCGVVALTAAFGVEHASLGFFIAVRFVVGFVSAYAAWKAFRAKKEILTWLLGANSALYNPFMLVRLTRGTWKVVDLADILLLIAAGILLSAREERSSQPVAPTGLASTRAPVPPPKAGVKPPSQRPRKLIWIFWAVYVATPITTGLLEYHWLPNESYDSTKHELLESHTVEVGPEGLESAEAPDRWQDDETGEVFTPEQFQEHRSHEAKRLSATSFLYGLIGCLFYSCVRAWQGSSSFKESLGKALLVNVVVAMIFALM